MGHGNNDVGKSGRQSLQMGSSSASARSAARQMAAAQPEGMSQPGNYNLHDHLAAPQKLVRLVGCHDPRMTAEAARKRISPTG